MENRLSYWVQLLPLPPEDRRRFTLELDLVAHRLTFRGVNRKISIEDDDSSFEVCYGNSFNTLFNRIICTYSPL